MHASNEKSIEIFKLRTGGKTRAPKEPMPPKEPKPLKEPKHTHTKKMFLQNKKGKLVRKMSLILQRRPVLIPKQTTPG